MGVEVLAEVRVQLLVVVGGWVEKNENNALLNSVEVKVEVGVEPGNIKMKTTSFRRLSPAQAYTTSVVLVVLCTGPSS